MLAHKVDGEHPTSYSDLILGAQKLERWAEARDPLLPKTTMTGGSNVTQPQASENLFPSRKLKGNCTFMAQNAIVESVGTKGDLTVGQGEKEEVELSEEDPETSSEIGGADQQISYIAWFANVVKLYQKKNWNCFGYGSPDHLVKDCPKDIGKVARKVSLNVEGTMKKGSQTPQKPTVTQLAFPDESPRS